MHSVIIPYYNPDGNPETLQLLYRAIDSACSALTGFCDFEVIVVDDGSPLLQGESVLNGSLAQNGSPTLKSSPVPSVLPQAGHDLESGLESVRKSDLEMERCSYSEIESELEIRQDSGLDSEGIFGLKFETRFPGMPVRYFRQEHQYLGAARNTGLDLAQGDTISFLDADDIYFAEPLRACFLQFETSGSDLLMFTFRQLRHSAAPSGYPGISGDSGISGVSGFSSTSHSDSTSTTSHDQVNRLPGEYPLNPAGHDPATPAGSSDSTVPIGHDPANRLPGYPHKSANHDPATPAGSSDSTVPTGHDPANRLPGEYPLNPAGHDPATPAGSSNSTVPTGHDPANRLPGYPLNPAGHDPANRLPGEYPLNPASPTTGNRYMTRHNLFGSSCLYLIRRAYLDSIGLRFAEGRYTEDEDFTTRLVWSCNKLTVTSLPVYGYCLRSGSITQTAGVERLEQRIENGLEALTKIVEFREKHISMPHSGLDRKVSTLALDLLRLSLRHPYWSHRVAATINRMAAIGIVPLPVRAYSLRYLTYTLFIRCSLGLKLLHLIEKEKR